MNARYRAYFSAILSMAALAGFLYVYARAFRASWEAAAAFSEPYGYVATMLAGLVGGIVAAGFGQQYPPAPNGAGPTWARVSGLAALVAAADPAQPVDRFRLVISVLYAAAYFVTGVGAVVVWIHGAERGFQVAELIRNLALISSGLAVAIVNGWIRGWPVLETTRKGSFPEVLHQSGPSDRPASSRRATPGEGGG